MKKRVLACCMALFVFTFTSLSVMAATCPPHQFDDHYRTNNGRLEDAGNHWYLFATEGGKEIYRDDCKLTRSYEYCQKQCVKCRAIKEDSLHEHLLTTKHSINHN